MRNIIVIIALITLVSACSTQTTEKLPGTEILTEVLTSEELSNYNQMSPLNAGVIGAALINGGLMSGPEVTGHTIDVTADSVDGGTVSVKGTGDYSSNATGMNMQTSLVVTFNDYIDSGKTINGSFSHVLTSTGTRTVDGDTETIKQTTNVVQKGSITIDGISYNWDYTMDIFAVDVMTSTSTTITTDFTLRGTVNGNDISHRYIETTVM